MIVVCVDGRSKSQQKVGNDFGGVSDVSIFLGNVVQSINSVSSTVSGKFRSSFLSLQQGPETRKPTKGHPLKPCDIGRNGGSKEHHTPVLRDCIKREKGRRTQHVRHEVDSRKLKRV